MQFGIIGSGSWATALAKILTDNKNSIHWWIRNSSTINQFIQRKHNPHYLHSAYFNTSLLSFHDNIEQVIAYSEVVLIAVPSAYIEDALDILPAGSFKGKKVVSGIKGIRVHFKLSH